MLRSIKCLQRGSHLQELPLVGKCSLTSCAASVLLRDALMLHSALFEALKEIRGGL